MGDHQGVPLDHQVQQFQESAAVFLGSAGLLGPNVAHGTAGAYQPLHLEVQILVLGLSHRDPGVTVQSVIRPHPWLEYLKYRILPVDLQPEFPATHSATGSGHLQRWGRAWASAVSGAIMQLIRLTSRAESDEADDYARWSERPFANLPHVSAHFTLALV